MDHAVLDSCEFVFHSQMIKTKKQAASLLTILSTYYKKERFRVVQTKHGKLHIYHALFSIPSLALQNGLAPNNVNVVETASQIVKYIL